MSEKSPVEIHLLYIREELGKINERLDKMEKQYVTKDEFIPVRNVVYGLVAVVLTSVIGALLAFVLR